MWSDLAYAVRLFRRRPAFGIGTILTLALGIGVLRAASVVGLGLATGVPLTLASSTALSSLLFEVSPRDPVVATVAVAALALLALAAAWLPARRAATVDPIIALRDV